MAGFVGGRSPTVLACPGFFSSYFPNSNPRDLICISFVIPLCQLLIKNILRPIPKIFVSKVDIFQIHPLPETSSSQMKLICCFTNNK